MVEAVIYDEVKNTSIIQMKNKMLYAGTLMSMTNACLGTAILQLGYRFSQTGYLFSSIFMIFATIFSFWSFRIITDITYASKCYSVRDLTLKMGGKTMQIVFDVCIIGMYFGIICNYCVVTADYIHSGFLWLSGNKICDAPLIFDEIKCQAYLHCQQQSHHIEFICLLIVGLGIFVIESFVTNIQILNLISSVVLPIVALTVIIVIVRVIQTRSTGILQDQEVEWTKPQISLLPIHWSGILKDLPSYLMLYGLQAFIPPYFDELKVEENLRHKIIKNSSDITVVVCSILYVLTAVMVPLIFNGKMQNKAYQYDNVLLNFSPSDIFVSIIKILYILVVVASFPAILFSIRSQIACIFKIDRQQLKGKVFFVLIGVVLCILATILALFVPNISTINDIFSSVFGVVIYMIMPLMLSLNRNKASYQQIQDVPMTETKVDIMGQDEDFLQDDQNEIQIEVISTNDRSKPLTKTGKVCNWILIITLTTIGLVSFFMTIAQLFNSNPSVCDQTNNK